MMLDLRPVLVRRINKGNATSFRTWRALGKSSKLAYWRSTQYALRLTSIFLLKKLL